MAKCTTGKEGFQPGGADVRVEYVRARARIVSAWESDFGVGRERRGFVFWSVIVRDCSSFTRDWMHDSMDVGLLLLLLLLLLFVSW